MVEAVGCKNGHAILALSDRVYFIESMTSGQSQNKNSSMFEGKLNSISPMTSGLTFGLAATARSSRMLDMSTKVPDQQ